jgi:hypothetical protein
MALSGISPMANSSGRDALLVASYPAGFFGNYLSTLGCSCLGPKNTSDDKQMQSNPAFLAERSNLIEIAWRLRTRTYRRMRPGTALSWS